MGVSNKARRDGTLSRQAGFTLIEVLIAAAIIGIAATIAIPNFTRMYVDYQTRVTASEITRHLVLVRTRAMTTNQTLSVQIVLVNGGVQMTTTNLAGVGSSSLIPMGSGQVCRVQESRRSRSEGLSQELQLHNISLTSRRAEPAGL